jgi:transcriptional regulator with XRE-family HTH domain
MKLKNFDDLVKKRLTKEEIAKIKQKAKLEAQIFRSMQEELKNKVNAYMIKHDLGFNEMIRRMGTSPSQFSRIQKGQANLTMASIAHISAQLDSPTTLQFKKR